MAITPPYGPKMSWEKMCILLFEYLFPCQISAHFAFKWSRISKKITFKKNKWMSRKRPKNLFWASETNFRWYPCFHEWKATKKYKTYFHQNLLQTELRLIFWNFYHFPLSNGRGSRILLNLCKNLHYARALWALASLSFDNMFLSQTSPLSLWYN